jgi:chorismate mutase
MSNFIKIGGPCSIESERQIYDIVRSIKNRTDIIRGGIWKPRTSFGTFEGVGEVGLQWVKNISDDLGVSFMIEVGLPKHIELCLKYGVNIFWLGARTSTNSFIINELSEVLKGVDCKVFIKNPINPDLSMWLSCFDRFRAKGTNDLYAIHRGFNIYPKSDIYRNVPIFSIVKDFCNKNPDIPMIIDPSHIVGNSSRVLDFLYISMVSGLYSGYMLEVHNKPIEAITDSMQQLSCEEYNAISLSSNGKSLLDYYRVSIDVCDDNILNNINERFNYVTNIGDYKKNNNSIIIDSDRYEKKLKVFEEKFREVKYRFFTKFI